LKCTTQNQNKNVSEPKFPFSQFFKRFLKEDYAEKTCCCCGNSLDYHIDEGKHWRCHGIDPSFFQCECTLSKSRSDSNILFYDLRRRITQMKKEEGI
jgi:hypothetical protein